jgi:hypothetical protein
MRAKRIWPQMNLARRSRNQTGERLLVIFFAGLAAWREIILADR